MKKYLFVFVLLASLATVACDTSSKASTTQTLAPTPTPQQQAVAAAPVAIDTTISPMQAKKGFAKKRDMMQAAPMTPEEKQKMLRAPEEKALPKN